MISPHALWYPPTVLSIPHGTQDNPHGTHDIPHGTEHPPRYSRYPPHLSWYPPGYWTPPRYSRYPPTVLMISSTVLSTPKVLHTHYTGWIQCTGCPKKIARIRRTQNRFSGNTFLICRVLVHLWTFFDSRGFTLLTWKKLIIHVLSEVMKRKTVNSYCFIITVFQNAKIFYVLLCSK